MFHNTGKTDCRAICVAMCICRCASHTVNVGISAKWKFWNFCELKKKSYKVLPHVNSIKSWIIMYPRMSKIVKIIPCKMPTFQYMKIPTRGENNHIYSVCMPGNIVSRFSAYDLPSCDKRNRFLTEG